MGHTEQRTTWHGQIFGTSISQCTDYQAIDIHTEQRRMVVTARAQLGTPSGHVAEELVVMLDWNANEPFGENSCVAHRTDLCAIFG